jgi:hypothetical protein
LKIVVVAEVMVKVMVEKNCGSGGDGDRVDDGGGGGLGGSDGGGGVMDVMMVKMMVGSHDE